MKNYSPATNRYNNKMSYNFCGNSGLQLPKLSLGLWHNFGNADNFDESKKMLFTAFDNGITHFDLANNYGVPGGSAESNFGKILKSDFANYRDEMIISTKAGYGMWEGPYGDGSSRKYLISSLDQSLKRMQLEYVDIFYSHHYNPETPIEETMEALSHIVRQGKALYVGLSNYPVEVLPKALQILQDNHTPCLIYQGCYNIINQSDALDGKFQLLKDKGVGYIVFSPLAQGVISDKYINGIPKDSRASKPQGFLQEKDIHEETINKMRQLNDLALKRGQSLAQMALAWVLSNPCVTSVLVGVSRVQQLTDNLHAIENTSFSTEEINLINSIMQGK